MRTHLATFCKPSHTTKTMVAAQSNVLPLLALLLTQGSASVSISNCAPCFRLPLMVGFQASCNASCAVAVAQAANVSVATHMTSLNFVTIETASDEALERLQADPRVAFIECDMCAYTKEYAPVCGTDGKTYSNGGELACANCPSDVSPVQIAQQGCCDDNCSDDDDEFQPR